MTDFHLVHFPSPEGFLEALRKYDDGFMNLPIGVLLDSIAEARAKARKPDSTPKTLLAVYQGDAIVYVYCPYCFNFY